MIGPASISWVRHPRLVAWFLLVTVAWVAVRVPFAQAYFLTSVAEFSPGFVLAPLAGLYAGPAGVAGIVAGTLLGDLLLGEWGGMTGYRVLAYGLSGLYMMTLAGPLTLLVDQAGRRQMALRLVPACLTAAAWIAVGGALQRLYPFAYLMGLNLGQFLLFSGLFAPAVLHLLSCHWIPRYGTWQDILGQPEAPPSVIGGRLIWGGGVAACGLGALFSGLIYDVWPVGRPWLGLHTGVWVTVPVLVCLGVQLLGIFVGGGTTRSAADPTDERFSRMYIPPLEKR